jgi:hypothetical protein
MFRGGVPTFDPTIGQLADSSGLGRHFPLRRGSGGGGGGVVVVVTLATAARTHVVIALGATMPVLL